MTNGRHYQGISRYMYNLLFPDPQNSCPLFCSAPTAKCVRIQRARSDGAFVQSSSQVRVAVFVAPPCPPELYVFRSGSGGWQPNSTLATFFRALQFYKHALGGRDLSPKLGVACIEAAKLLTLLYLCTIGVCWDFACSLVLVASAANVRCRNPPMSDVLMSRLMSPLLMCPPLPPISTVYYKGVW